LKASPKYRPNSSDTHTAAAGRGGGGGGGGGGDGGAPASPDDYRVSIPELIEFMAAEGHSEEEVKPLLVSLAKLHIQQYGALLSLATNPP
jgi:hypothetical protein